MNAPALGQFLASLEADGIYVTIRDYDRIALLLGTGDPWSLARLRDTLLALLAKDESQQETLLRRFSDFFAFDLENDPSILSEEDLTRALANLRQPVQPDLEIDDFKITIGPIIRTFGSGFPLSPDVPDMPESKSRKIRLSIAVSATLIAVILTAVYFLLHNFFPTLTAPPVALPTFTPQSSPTAIDPDTSLSGYRRQYEDVPVITATEVLVRGAPIAWLPYGIASLLLGVGAVGYFVHIQRSRRIPEDQAPVWHKDGPRHFRIGLLGDEPAPLFSEAELDELADSMGYFLGDDLSQELDVLASIQTTMRHGGISSLSFYRRHSVRSLLILEDAYSESSKWNPIARQLATGMERRGIEVTLGRFFGSPSQFRISNGPVIRLEDIEDQRNRYVILLFSDSHKWSRDATYAIEVLSRWPMVAWMELREPRFWDNATLTPADYGIPIFPATSVGTILAIRRFLTEQGAIVDWGDKARRRWGTSSASRQIFDVYVEELLGDAFPLAQACALCQPVSLGLVDALRRKFFPELLFQCTGRLFALPDTRQTVAGLYFSADVLRVLRSTFFSRYDDAVQERILLFLLAEIDRKEPTDHESIAHLTWESVRERIHLELDQDVALERLARLAKTPLGPAISDSLLGFGFRDEGSETIPLRLKPEKQEAWQRLARIAPNFNISRLDKYPISTQQWSVFVALVVASIATATIASWRFLAPPELPQSLVQIQSAPNRVAAILEQQDGGIWEPTLSGYIDDSVGNWPDQFWVPPGQTFRLSVYEVGHRDVYSFTSAEHSNLMLNVSLADKSYDCIERHPEIGVTVYRCPEPEPLSVGGTVLNPALWRDRWHGKASSRLLASIGVEFDRAGSDNSRVRLLRNTLLATQAVDIVFRIDSSEFDSEQVTEAVHFIGQTLGPLTSQSRVLVWHVGNVPVLGVQELHRVLMSRVIPIVTADTDDVAKELRELASAGNTWLPISDIIDELERRRHQLLVSIPTPRLPPSISDLDSRTPTPPHGVSDATTAQPTPSVTPEPPERLSLSPEETVTLSGYLSANQVKQYVFRGLAGQGVSIERGEGDYIVSVSGVGDGLRHSEFGPASFHHDIVFSLQNPQDYLINIRASSETAYDLVLLPKRQCFEWVTNGTFESPIFLNWNPQGFVVADPSVKIGGTFSARIGLTASDPNQNIASSIRQPINLPAGFDITLSFRWFPKFDLDITEADVQFVNIQTSNGSIIPVVPNTKQNSTTWQVVNGFPLNSLAGQQITLIFGVNNDGVGSKTWMYVDNVSIVACATFAATATANPQIATLATATPDPQIDQLETAVAATLTAMSLTPQSTTTSLVQIATAGAEMFSVEEDPVISAMTDQLTVQPSITPKPLPTSSLSELSFDEWQTAYLTNLERRKVGLPPLGWQEELALSALGFAKDVLVNQPADYCGHIDSQGRTPGERIRLSGFDEPDAWGENTVCGYSLPEAAVRAWVNSPGHRSNILDDRFRAVGVGYARTSDGRGFVVLDLASNDRFAPVIINDGAPSTDSSNVRLYIYDQVLSSSSTGQGASVEMMVANDASFSDATWQSYVSELDWELSPGDGWKTVYVMTRDALGQTSVVEDSIFLGDLASELARELTIKIGQ